MTKTVTLTYDGGTPITTSDKKKIKELKACGWRVKKEPKIYYAKGLQSGNTFLK